MELGFTKRGHNILLKVDRDLLSMVGYPGTHTAVSGVRSEILGSKEEAMVEFRKMSGVLQGNGYKLSRKER